MTESTFCAARASFCQPVAVPQIRIVSVSVTFDLNHGTQPEDVDTHSEKVANRRLGTGFAAISEQVDEELSLFPLLPLSCCCPSFIPLIAMHLTAGTANNHMSRSMQIGHFLTVSMVTK